MSVSGRMTRTPSPEPKCLMLCRGRPRGALLEFTDGVIAKMVPIAALLRRAVRA
jgi:hypothetical protein